MKYTSLYKKFFMDPAHFEEDYQSLLHDPSTVIFNINIHNYPVFLSVNPELLKLIEEIYEYNNKIIMKTRGNRELPLISIDWLTNFSLIEEIKMTNEMESISSTRKQLKELMETKNPTTYLRFYGMVNKFRKLLSGQEIMLHDSMDIRKLYDEILIQDIQKEDPKDLPDGIIFRKNQVEVDSFGKTIHDGSMPEERIIEIMNQSIQILNDEKLPLLIRVAIFHYLFGYIHPFYEGNGRMLRFISSAYLCKTLDILCALQLSISCKQNQKKYYEAFKITNDIRNRADITTFVFYFLEIIKDGLIHLLETVENKTEQFFFFKDKISNKKINNKEKELLFVLLQATLFDFEGLTIKDLENILDYSSVTIRSYLNSKSISSMIDIDTKDKSYRYSLLLDKI